LKLAKKRVRHAGAWLQTALRTASGGGAACTRSGIARSPACGGLQAACGCEDRGHLLHDWSFFIGHWSFFI